MSKKIIIVLIEIAIILGILTISSQASGEEVKFKVQSSQAENQKEVSIKVDMESQADFVAANFELKYDVSKLEYVNSKKGEILETGIMALVNNNSETGKISIAYVANPTEANHTKEAGNLVTVTFKIKSEATGTVDLNLACTTLKKQDGTVLTPNITQGNITIVSKENIETIPSIENQPSAEAPNSGNQEKPNQAIVGVKNEKEQNAIATNSDNKVQENTQVAD